MLGIHLFECPAKSPVQLEKLPPQPQSRMILKMQSSIPLKWSTRSHVLVTHLRPLSDTRFSPENPTVLGASSMDLAAMVHKLSLQHLLKIQNTRGYGDASKFEGSYIHIIYSTVNLLVKKHGCISFHDFDFWGRVITLIYLDFRQKILINTEQTVGNSIPHHIKPPSKRANPRHFFPQWVKGCPYKSTIFFAWNKNCRGTAELVPELHLKVSRLC